MLARLVNHLRRRQRIAALPAARREFFSIRVTGRDCAIDCGANVGAFTVHLASRGGTVYAFEPNPSAFARLRDRFAASPHVRCLQQGVLDQPGRASLYFHERAAEDPVKWSTGSSLLPFKRNVLEGSFVEVEVIDLSAFVLALDRRVKILKMDVEGVECRVLQRMIDTGALRRVDHCFVETHEEKIPELRDETAELRSRLEQEGYANVRLGWG